jgi:hypothetical protein
MMSGKTDELGRRWQRTMGDESPAGLEYPVISDANKERLERIDLEYEKTTGKKSKEEKPKSSQFEEGKTYPRGGKSYVFRGGMFYPVGQ